MNENVGWTIFGVALVIGACVLTFLGTSYHNNENKIMAGAGLQECKEIGTQSTLWQKECRR